MIEQAALANPLSLMLDKERSDFTRADMLKIIRERGIERLSFHYTSVDGKLRELKLPFSDFTQAERILASGRAGGRLVALRRAGRCRRVGSLCRAELPDGVSESL